MKAGVLDLAGGKLGMRQTPKHHVARSSVSKLGQEQESDAHLVAKRDIVERMTTRARFEGARVGAEFGEPLSAERQP